MDIQTLEHDPALTGGIYCGPAIVLEIGPSSLRLQLPAREARAEMALGYPYQPQPNDLVLALGAADGDVYVVGVLRGRGRTRLTVEGDLHITASGRLTLQGGESVSIEGERVAVNAERYELAARSVIERLGSAYRWATGVIMTCAGRTRTVVEQNATLAAGRIVQKARQDVVIDGEKIRLG